MMSATGELQHPGWYPMATQDIGDPPPWHSSEPAPAPQARTSSLLKGIWNRTGRRLSNRTAATTSERNSSREQPAATSAPSDTASTARESVASPNSSELPWGWEKQTNIRGETQFFDTVRQATSSTDPRTQPDVAYTNYFLCPHCRYMLGHTINRLAETDHVFSERHKSTLLDFLAALEAGCFICSIIDEDSRKWAEQAGIQPLDDHWVYIESYSIAFDSMIAFDFQCSCSDHCETLQSMSVWRIKLRAEVLSK
jgi:hypothetical protein